MQEIRDPFIDSLAEATGVDPLKTAAAVLFFLDRLPHEAVATKLGITPQEAASLADTGLLEIKAYTDAA